MGCPGGVRGGVGGEGVGCLHEEAVGGGDDPVVIDGSDVGTRGG